MNAIPAFVKNDIDLMRFFKRIEKRTERYPGWRQVFWDCSGMCQYPLDAVNGICGEMETLEYHEIYDSNDKVVQIVLLCNYHHFAVHNGIVNLRRYPSMSAKDIEIEMLLVGGGNEWKQKYNIVDRKVKYDFSNDNRKIQVCLLVSENE